MRLVAQGNTSRQIGGGLFLSPRTVEMHVQNAMTKLQYPHAGRGGPPARRAQSASDLISPAFRSASLSRLVPSP
jgi:DNA-binding NarL/FixJ family response regulator